MMKRCFLLFLLLGVAGIASAQDRVHLKEAQRLGGYEAQAGEGFRLRAVDKRSLTVELPDSTLVKIRRKDVAESDAPLVVLKNAPMFTTADAAYHPEAAKSRSPESIIEGAEIREGERLEMLDHKRRVYRVRNSQGVEGWIGSEAVLPQLTYMVTGGRDKIVLQKHPERRGAGDNLASVIAPGGRLIPLEVSGDKMKLRDAAGNDGWTDAYVIAERDLRGGLYKLLWNLCNWSGKGFFAWLLVAVIYALGLVIWAVVPALLVYRLVVYIKYIPNLVCKLLLGGVLLIFYFLTGLWILELPPMDDSTGWAMFIGFMCLCMGLMTISNFWNMITAERCPYWKCHAVGDYTVTDMSVREWDEITTTTRTYSDGYTSTSENTEHKSSATYYKRCNRCGTGWTARS